MKTPINIEDEQMPMVSKKRTTNLRRTSSVCENDHTITYQGQRRNRIPQRSDTVAIV